MNLVSHEVHILSVTGQVQAVLADGYVASLTYGLKENAPGVLELVLPDTFNKAYLIPDGQIVVYRSYGGGQSVLEGETAWFIRQVQSGTTSEGTKIIKVLAYSACSLLERRIVAYPAGSSQADKLALPWDTLLYQYVSENFSTDAVDTTRDISPWFVVKAVDNAGASHSKSAPWRNVLEVLTEIADEVRSTGIYCAFDVVRLNNYSFEFRVYAYTRGTDHSKHSSDPIVVSEQRGNLAQPVLLKDWSLERNYIYATGQGQKDERLISTATDASRATISPFGRTEYNHSARQAETAAALTAEANAALQELRPQKIFSGTIIQTDGSLYNVHWRWGDIVTVEYGDDNFDCHVDAVIVSIDLSTGTENVSGLLRGVSNNA